MVASNQSGISPLQRVAFPFRCADQMAVRQPLAAMVDNGWRREKTLGNEMFDAEKNTLTKAGYIKANWIVTQAPVQRRTVWVLRARVRKQPHRESTRCKPRCRTS